MKLNYKEYGSGKPLLILHGLFGSLDNWHTLSRKWAEDFHVFALDLRNHGKSPHDDQFNYEVMAADVKEFITDHLHEPVMMLGHSMGGKVAMQVALEHPELVSHLLVADMAPRDYKGGHDEILEALETFPVKNIESRKEADAILAEKISEPGIRQFLLKNLERSGEGYSWKMNLPVILQKYPAIMENTLPEKTFDKPVLFLKGEKSNYIREADANQIRKYFPNARIEAVDGAGHWVHAENPEAVYQAVMEMR